MENPERVTQGEARSIRQAPAEPPMVELRHVTKVYTRAAGGRVAALAEASFRIARGELVVVVGPAGSGKSTLLRLVSGEERPSRGTVLVEDEDGGALGRRGLARVRRRLGVVPQDLRLVGDRTALGNVTVVLQGLGTARGEARGRALRALRAVGLGERPNVLPAELAGGEQRRLAIARALATGPRVLLADEPFGPGEAGVGADLLDLVRAVNAQGTTVLVATRTSDLAGALGARALVLDRGRLCAPGEVPASG
jgi:ABC-type ATPase involved in cell division